MKPFSEKFVERLHYLIIDIKLFSELSLLINLDCTKQLLALRFACFLG